QRDLRRRDPPALLLPAGAQARRAPCRAGGRRDLGQREVLPRHRQRAARRPPEGARERLRRLLHRIERARALRRSLRRGRCIGPARSLRELQRPGLLRAAAQHRQRDPAPGNMDTARSAAVRRRATQAAERRRNNRVETAAMIEKQARIALLIDADNSPASKIDVILAELAKAGVTNIRRAYGNWKKDGLKGWEAVLHEYAIRPVQQ